jgi:hypothetical protein
MPVIGANGYVEDFHGFPLDKMKEFVQELTFVVEIEAVYSQPASSFENFGEYSTGDASLDRQLRSAPVTMMKTVEEIAAVFNEGGKVAVRDPKVALRMINLIEAYLNAFQDKYRRSMRSVSPSVLGGIDQLDALAVHLSTIYGVYAASGMVKESDQIPARNRFGRAGTRTASESSKDVVRKQSERFKQPEYDDEYYDDEDREEVPADIPVEKPTVYSRKAPTIANMLKQRGILK